MYVTEDTTRTDAATVEALYSAAIRCGAQAIVLCDTVGHATPMGAYNLVKFAREKIVAPSGASIRVDWHGHCDRGLAIANSFAAIAAGADQIQSVANSLGERVGNTPTELMLVNMQLLGMIDRDLSKLRQFSETVARATHTVIPPNYPVVGRDAFRTATGVHAAALIKAQRMGDAALADARLQRRPRIAVRPGTNYRSRPDERQIQRPALDGPPRHSPQRRNRAARPRRRKTRLRHIDR